MFIMAIPNFPQDPQSSDDLAKPSVDSKPTNQVEAPSLNEPVKPDKPDKPDKLEDKFPTSNLDTSMRSKEVPDAPKEDKIKTVSDLNSEFLKDETPDTLAQTPMSQSTDTQKKEVEEEPKSDDKFLGDDVSIASLSKPTDNANPAERLVDVPSQSKDMADTSSSPVQPQVERNIETPKTDQKLEQATNTGFGVLEKQEATPSATELETVEVPNQMKSENVEAPKEMPDGGLAEVEAKSIPSDLTSMPLPEEKAKDEDIEHTVKNADKNFMMKLFFLLSLLLFLVVAGVAVYVYMI